MGMLGLETLSLLVLYLCFIKNKNVFEKGEMGQAGDKWHKKWGELGQMKMSGPAEK